MEVNAFSQKLWQDLSKENRMQNECMLNEKQTKKIYQINREGFKNMLNLQKDQEMCDLFDHDQDGYLNEDEQVLIFSTLKSKMQKVAQQLR